MKVFGLTTATATGGDVDVSLEQCDGTESLTQKRRRELQTVTPRGAAKSVTKMRGVFE